MKRNELRLVEGMVFRVLSVNQNESNCCLINCEKVQMPKIFRIEQVCDCVVIESYDFHCRSLTELTCEEVRVMNERFNSISQVIPFADNKRSRNSMLKEAAGQFGKSVKTLSTWLCLYLAAQRLEILAPNRVGGVVCELSEDEKNFQWALNKFYYTRHKNTVMFAYLQMIHLKYTDEEGAIVETAPTIRQFRYFLEKNNSKRKEIISREGIKNYEMNHRPLLGESVRDFCPTIGYGMFDATVCDIYLADGKGNVVGRPYLVACVDAYSGIIMGYFLGWEGGIYSVRTLFNNVLEDKVEMCRRLGISIRREQWNCCGVIPRVFITDRGTEYVGQQFEQLVEIGVEITNLPSYRAELKGPVEQVFNLAQNLFKEQLKGMGVIQPDFQKRGAKDYRKEARLVLEQFEKIIVHCIIFYNSQRVIRSFPFTPEMMEEGIKPFSSDIWNHGFRNFPDGVIAVSKDELQLRLLPRTECRFTRKGLMVNGFRYKNEDYVDHYLTGKKGVAAYNPDNLNNVWFLENGNLIPFTLIETTYSNMSLDSANEQKLADKNYKKKFERETLQGRVDLINNINSVVTTADPLSDPSLKNISKTRNKERQKVHKDLLDD